MTDDDPGGLRQLHHDLRAPLVIVTGFAQLLAAEGDLDPELRRDYARRIAKAGDEVTRLLEQRLGD